MFREDCVCEQASPRKGALDTRGCQKRPQLGVRTAQTDSTTATFAKERPDCRTTGEGQARPEISKRCTFQYDEKGAMITLLGHV